MTTQILFPAEFDNLSDDDQKLAEELMKSILQGEEASRILVRLLSGKELDNDVKEIAKNIREKNINLKIITHQISAVTAVTLSTNAEEAMMNPTTRNLDDIIFADRTNACKDVCSNATTPREVKACQKCQQMFNIP